jgi:hypothetical protein
MEREEEERVVQKGSNSRYAHRRVSHVHSQPPFMRTGAGSRLHLGNIFVRHSLLLQCLNSLLLSPYE